MIGTFLNDGEGYVSRLTLCDNNTKLLSGGSRGLELWDVARTKLLKTITISSGGWLLADLDSYPYVFIGHDDGAVTVVDCALGLELFSIPGGGERVESLSMSADKLRLIVNGQWIMHLFWDYDFPDRSTPSAV